MFTIAVGSMTGMGADDAETAERAATIEAVSPWAYHGYDETSVGPAR